VAGVFASARFPGANRVGHLSIWPLVFPTVALQMSTCLLPITCKSDEFLPGGKLFFLHQWLKGPDGTCHTRGRE